MNAVQRKEPGSLEAWKYLLGAAIALIILAPLWIAFDLGDFLQINRHLR